MERKCYACSLILPIDTFVKDKYTKDGYKFICKPCSRIKSKEYRQRNPSKARENMAEWRKQNKQYWSDYCKHRRGTKTDFVPKAREEKRSREDARAHIKANKTAYDKSHYAEQKEYRVKRKDERNAYYRQYRKDRSKRDAQFKMVEKLRSRLYLALKGKKKTAKTIDLLGCTLDFFVRWIERNFENGMTWENHGYGDDKWNLDHNLPCASFDLANPEEQRKCFHWSNLFPMWQKHNLIKSDSIVVCDYQI